MQDTEVERPKFPEEFHKEACPRVKECENCGKFLTSPTIYEEEKKFLPLIEQYYRDLDEWD